MKAKELYLEDAERICELYRLDFKDGYSLNVLKASFESGRFLSYGIILKEKIVSVVTASLSGEEADIDGLVTHREEKRKGYGKYLINFLIDRLKEKGVKKLFLEVRESNRPAKSLYTSLGFNEINVRKNYYKDGENAIIMLKEI